MGRLSGGSSGGGRLGKPSTASSQGFTPEQLQSLVSASKLPELKPHPVLNTLEKVSRVLNIGTAAVAGATRGAIRGDMSIAEGVKQGIKENIGFSDVIRQDLNINPDNRLGKIGVSVAGFLADVAFDPLTYLTLGMGSGLKVSGKVITQEGTKLAQKAATEIVEKNVAEALARGVSEEAARKIGGRGVSGVVNDLVQRTFGKKGITEAAAEDFLQRGISQETISTFRELGPKILDQGGVKFFGKTLVTSKQLSKTIFGRAAKRLGETEIAKAVGNVGTVIGDSLGKTFVPDFMKNPRLVRIIDNAKRTQKQAMKGIVEANKALFEGLNDDQMSSLFTEIFSKKKQIISDASVISEETISDLNKAFPDLGVKDAEHAKKLLNLVEDKTIEDIKSMRQRIDDLVKPFFEKRQARIEANAGSELAGGAGKAIQKTPAYASMQRVDDLNKVVNGLREELKSLRKNIPKIPALPGKEKVIEIGGDITDDELINVQGKLIKYEEERLASLVDNLSERIAKTKEKITSGKGIVGGKTVAKGAVEALPLSPEETIVFSERRITQLQNELTEKTRMLDKVINARRVAKAAQKTQKLAFDDPALQAVADKLFEGPNAIVPKFAKIAGLSEDDAIKFYIPSIFEDKVRVKDFAVGRNLSSASYGWLKEFGGVENDKLIRDPFTAYATRQVQVATARIKADAFQNALKSMGREINELTPEAAKELGWSKVSRKSAEGMIEGWLPKDVAEELNKFIGSNEVGTIDQLAKATGFDWATGLFKSYVTSLFPGFHIRNITSNQFQNMLKIGVDTLDPAKQVKALQIALNTNRDAKFVTKMGRTYTNGEIHDLLRKSSDILERDATSYGTLEHLLENSKSDIYSRMSNFSPLSQHNALLKAGRKIGGLSESQAKIVSVLHALNEGKSLKEGVQMAEEALFNYSKLTDMEKSVFRRIIPFYTFARKNAEYQIRMLAKNPGRVAAQIKAIRGLSGAVGEPISEEDKKGLPNWVLDSLGIKAGANQWGQSTFLTGFGLPIEEFLQRFSGDKGITWNFTKNVLAQVNPILKFPAERATGVDFFRGRPITEISNAQDLKALFDVMPEKVATQMKDLIQYREIPDQPVYVNGKIVGYHTKYTANPFALHLLRSVPTSRAQTTLGFLTSDTESSTNKALRFFTGVRGFAIDQEQQKFYNDLDRSRELEDYLIRMGVGKQFTRFFIPQNSKKSILGSKKKGRLK